MTWVWYAGRISLGFGMGIEIECGDRNKLVFLNGGRIWGGFCVCIEIDLVFGVGTEIDFVLCMGVDDDLSFIVGMDHFT